MLKIIIEKGDSKTFYPVFNNVPQAYLNIVGRFLNGYKN